MDFIKKFDFMSDLVQNRYENLQQGFIVVDNGGIILAGPSNWVHQKLPIKDYRYLSSLPQGAINKTETAHAPVLSAVAMVAP